MRLVENIRRVVVDLSMVALFMLMVQPFAVGQTHPMQASSLNAPPASPASPDARRYPAAPAKNGALFHGQAVRWPKMPFARQRATAQAPVGSSRAAAQPARNAGGQGSRFATGQRSGIAPSSQQHGTPPRAAMTNRAVPTSSSPAATLSAPSGTPLPAAQPTSAAPKSPAEQLLAQAHEWSASAQTEADYTRTIEACRRAAASQPSPAIARYSTDLTSWALNRRGQLYADASRDAEALRDFEDAVRANPERWRALHNRGVLLAQAGKFARAFDDFNRTIQLQPEFAKAYSNRAALFEVAGQLPKALEDFKRASELDPKLAVAHRGQGRARHLLGQLAEAVRHYDVAVRLAPNDTSAVASRAAVLTDLGRYREAAAGYENAIKLDPKSSYALGGSAWLLATCPDESVRNPALAIERAQAAIELTGGNEAASFDTLAAAQANAGDFSAAVNSIRRAVDLAPTQEREIYQDRLLTYQNAKPYRIAPVESVTQTSFESN